MAGQNTAIDKNVWMSIGVAATIMIITVIIILLFDSGSQSSNSTVSNEPVEQILLTNLYLAEQAIHRYSLSLSSSDKKRWQLAEKEFSQQLPHVNKSIRGEIRKKFSDFQETTNKISEVSYQQYTSISLFRGDTGRIIKLIDDIAYPLIELAYADGADKVDSLLKIKNNISNSLIIVETYLTQPNSSAFEQLNALKEKFNQNKQKYFETSMTSEETEVLNEIAVKFDDTSDVASSVLMDTDKIQKLLEKQTNLVEQMTAKIKKIISSSNDGAANSAGKGKSSIVPAMIAGFGVLLSSLSVLMLMGIRKPPAPQIVSSPLVKNVEEEKAIQKEAELKEAITLSMFSSKYFHALYRPLPIPRSVSSQTVPEGSKILIKSG